RDRLARDRSRESDQNVLHLHVLGRGRRLDRHRSRLGGRAFHWLHRSFRRRGGFGPVLLRGLFGGSSLLPGLFLLGLFLPGVFLDRVLGLFLRLLDLFLHRGRGIGRHLGRARRRGGRRAQEDRKGGGIPAASW